jgi:S-DNA-T family DNA segregation ATPase FtsK/SpoIIIE
MHGAGKAEFMGKPTNDIIARRVKEGMFIILSALALFFLVALVSYNTNDPGWSRATAASKINNYAGTVGAWSADILLYFFGYVAYLLPPVLAWAGVLSFRDYKHKSFPRLLRALQTFGFILFLTSACSLVNMALSSYVTERIPGPAGGIIGSVVTSLAQQRFSTAGSALLFTAMFLVGVTLATGASWVKLLELLGKLTITIVVRATRGLGYAASVVLRYIYNYLRELLLRPFSRIKPKFAMPQVKQSAPAKAKPRLDPDFAAASFKHEESRVRPQIVPLVAKAQLELKVTNKGPRNSKLPDIALLEPAMPSDPRKHYSKAALESLSREVEERLLDFGVEVKVVAVCPGPIITRFEMTLAPGLKVSKITGLAKDLARSLSVNSVRVVEVIPGKAVVGLEIPNKHREIVKLREVLESPQYQEKDGPMNLALGKDISGVPVVVNLANMPHLLVAGTTGSGKSVGVNVMLLSLLFKASPNDLRLILIDPKMLELSIYDGIGHLLTPVVTDMNDAANALRWCVAEMERRYQIMAAVGVRNLAGYNAKVIQANIDGKPIVDPLWVPGTTPIPRHLEKLPYVVVIIDEFADMMMVVGKKVEELIARIAQKARAAGIHMILATQRPSVDVITGLIKANVPTRIAFQVSSRIDSRTILDQQGAEQLIGHGDMLYLAPGAGIPTRVHGAFVSDEEVHAVVNAIKQSGPPPDYIEEIAVGTGLSVPGIDPIEDLGEQDPLYDEAVAIVTDTKKASISYLQRRLRIGYNRSARLIEAMEAAGVVSEMLSNGSREVLAFEVPRK